MENYHGFNSREARPTDSCTFLSISGIFFTLIHAMNSMRVSLKLGTNIASKQLLVFRLFDVCTQSNEN